MAQIDESLDGLEQRLLDLEGTIGTADAMTGAFRAEMEDVSGAMRTATQDAGGLSRSLGTTLKGAFGDLVLDGARLSEVMAQVGRSFSDSVLNAALRPVANAVGGAITSGLGGMLTGAFANGGVMAQGRVQAFAKGGVVDGPTTFGIRGGIGLMGEAGAEAIMPLRRGPDGRLGVEAPAGGGRGVTVNMTVSTPDVAGFARSRSQIAAQMSRALGRSNRNL